VEAGGKEIEQGGLEGREAALMQATLMPKGSGAFKQGDPLPGLWHWAAFPPNAAMEDLGADGHPAPGDFLPPLPGTRRMWAGGALQLKAPLHVGEPIQRQTVIKDITPKDGRAGQMVFVTLEHRITGTAGLAIVERQDIVYLPPATRYAPPKPLAMPATPILRAAHDATEPLLFRYSALTFNSHRIHYDLAYAQQVEHYPGLVVHGPLQATWLMAAATRHRGRPPAEFHYRGVHPVFTGPVDIAATEEDGALMLCTGQDGHQGMTATAIWEETV